MEDGVGREYNARPADNSEAAVDHGTAFGKAGKGTVQMKSAL